MKQGNYRSKKRTPAQKAKRKRRQIGIFIAEIFALLILLVVFWGVTQVKKIGHVTISEEDIVINKEVEQLAETGAMKGYRNIALFAVDSTQKQLEMNTRTDTIMIASIDMDSKEIRLVSVYRDTYLNLGTDQYNKANSAYSYGGAKQAISMLNMNMDLNITDFVTTGYDGLVDAIDAVGGIEIDVTEAEIDHLNNYQMCIVGRPDGTLNAAGEPNYYAEPYVEFTPVTKPGLQTLNGVQATAYCRIRYVGNDFARTQRQRTVIEKLAKKALTLNPATLNKIAESVLPKVYTSLSMGEILELLSGATGYKFVEKAAFPFDGHFKSGVVNAKKGDCIVPQSLEDNVVLLHQFFFGEEDYTPSETVKRCSEKIKADTANSSLH